MITQSRAWQIFIICMSLVTAYWTAAAVHQVNAYVHLTGQMQPDQITWTYQEVSSDLYAPLATFTFTTEGKQIQGSTLLSRPRFRSASAAESVLQELKKQMWPVWYAPGRPEQATIERRFPLKDCLSALILLGLFVYFVLVRLYVRRFEGDRKCR